MSAEYPYALGNNRLGPLFDKIDSAGKPERFSQDFLEKLGFASSNDRAFPRLLRFLGFLDENFRPTAKYDLLKDSTRRRFVLAEQIREAYREIFDVNTNIYKAPDQENRGTVGRVTGKDETQVSRISATFRALGALADFSGLGQHAVEEPPEIDDRARAPSHSPAQSHSSQGVFAKDFHYNIQIHLPATTEIAVYQAIFRSLKDTLGM